MRRSEGTVEIDVEMIWENKGKEDLRVRSNYRVTKVKDGERCLIKEKF